MAKQEQFQVSKKGIEGVKVNANLPESIDDPRWAEIVAGDHKAAINELAVQNLIIKIQGGARAHLEGGQAKVQQYVDGYKYGGRNGGGGASAKVVKLDSAAVATAKFSPEQIAMLRAAGVVIPGDETTPEVTADSKTAGAAASAATETGTKGRGSK